MRRSWCFCSTPTVAAAENIDSFLRPEVEGWLPFLWKYLHEYKWRYLKTPASAWQDRNYAHNVLLVQNQWVLWGCTSKGSTETILKHMLLRETHNKMTNHDGSGYAGSFSGVWKQSRCVYQNQTLIFLSCSLCLLTAISTALSQEARISSIIVLFSSSYP